MGHAIVSRDHVLKSRYLLFSIAESGAAGHSVDEVDSRWVVDIIWKFEANVDSLAERNILEKAERLLASSDIASRINLF